MKHPAKVEIDPQTQKNINLWLEGPYDEASKNEILRLQRENLEELVDAFYQKLAFGTGGLRGIMGVGTNRMNVYTVRAATLGLARYLAKQSNQTKSVLIGFDSRNHSREFAEECAKILAAENIEVYLYKEPRPVAFLSFGTLYKKCSAAVMITASHNPPKYNGYKVWWSDGVQVLPPHDKGIMEEVNKIQDFIPSSAVELSSPLIHHIGEEMDRAYLDAIRDLALHRGNNHSYGKNLKIIYSNVHGSGFPIVPKALCDWGFTNISLVEEQKALDGNFPTVKSPNPEEKETLELGIKQLEKENGDIFLATDPDCDRVALTVWHHQKPVLLNGNEGACIIFEHICRALEKIPPKAASIKTIVTTELFKAIAARYHISCLDVLTGFKYIGEKIAKWDTEAHAHNFVFGGEESYGYLYGTHARDKDAIISCIMLAEAALHQKLQGKTLVDFLHEIYQKYGIYREGLLSLTYEGKEGAEKMQKLMNHFRENIPTTLGNTLVTTCEDYLKGESWTMSSKKKEPIHLPKSDVIRLFLADGTKIVVRPSGTEPKLKIYCGCHEKHFAHDVHALEKLQEKCDKRCQEYLSIVKRLLQ